MSAKDSLQQPAPPTSAVPVTEWLERFALVLVWAATIAVFGALRPESFLTWSTFSTILGSQAVIVILALGLVVPLTCNDYDLSIASNLTLAGTVLALLNVRLGVPIAWSILGALAVGALVGFVNGFFVIYFRINSLIVTLGVGTFIHGITLWLGNQQTISGVSEGLVTAVIVTRVFGVPLGFYYALLLCAVIWYVLSYTALGRRMLFVGRGREVARLSRNQGRPYSLGLPGRVGTDRRHGGCGLCRNDGRRRPKLWTDLPAARLRRSLSWRDHRQSRPLQSLGCDDQRVFPGHRYHRAIDPRRQHLRSRSVLRWRAGDRRDPVADRAGARGAAGVMRRVPRRRRQQ